MKKLTIIFLILFLVILFLGSNVSAFRGSQEVVTGKFKSYYNDMQGGVVVQISIVGSSLSGSLETINFISGVDQGTANGAFIDFAESLNCTLGNTITSDDPMPMGQTSISFVCEGTHRVLIDKITDLLIGILTFGANAEP